MISSDPVLFAAQVLDDLVMPRFTPNRATATFASHVAASVANGLPVPTPSCPVVLIPWNEAQAGILESLLTGFFGKAKSPHPVEAIRATLEALYSDVPKPVVATVSIPDRPTAETTKAANPTVKRKAKAS